MVKRVVLPDCCEDWILQYGRFYWAQDLFHCPECRTAWQKLAPGQFRREGDGKVFAECSRSSEGAQFRYLAPVASPGPLVERCCAKIILAYGPSMRPGPFYCPVCRAHWVKDERVRGGLSIPCYQREDLPEPLAIQSGATRPFLVPLSAYSQTTE